VAGAVVSIGITGAVISSVDGIIGVVTVTIGVSIGAATGASAAGIIGV
jgi:hypothetical protein